MVRIIKNAELKKRKQNIKALKILVNQYLKDGKEKTIKRIKRDQS